FDAFLQHYNLTDRALHQLALIVRGADTARHDLAPQARACMPSRLDFRPISPTTMRCSIMEWSSTTLSTRGVAISSMRFTTGYRPRMDHRASDEACLMSAVSDAARPQPTRIPIHRVAAYFLRLGTLGFGGPIALCGLMDKDLVQDRHWLTKEE